MTKNGQGGYDAELDTNKPSPLTHFTRTSSYQREMARLTDGGVAKMVAAMWGLYLVCGFLAYLMVGSVSMSWWLPGLVLGAALLAATVLIVAWWMGYRFSDEQLRHQLLARQGVVAQRREVRDHVGAKVVLKKAATFRPTFAARAKVSRAYGFAPTLFPQQVAQGIGVLQFRAQNLGTTPDSKSETLVCEYVVKQFARVPVAAENSEGSLR
jgi:hypothetical protein